MELLTAKVHQVQRRAPEVPGNEVSSGSGTAEATFECASCTGARYGSLHVGREFAAQECRSIPGALLLAGGIPRDGRLQ